MGPDGRLRDEVGRGRGCRALDVGLFVPRGAAEGIGVVRRIVARVRGHAEGVQHLLEGLAVDFELADARERGVELVLEIVRVARRRPTRPTEGLGGLRRRLAGEERDERVLVGQNGSNLLDDSELGAGSDRGIRHEVIETHGDLPGGVLHLLAVLGSGGRGSSTPVDGGHDVPFQDGWRKLRLGCVGVFYFLVKFYPTQQPLEVAIV